MFQTLLFLATMFLAMNQSEPLGEKDAVANIPEEVKVFEDSIFRFLQNEKNWTDPKQKEKVHLYLKIAKAIPSKTLVPILVKNITFAPYDGVPNPRLDSLDTSYPAYAVMKVIGLPVVESLLNRLKRMDLEVRGEDVYRDFFLSVDCIVAIYERGGEGTELARRRIELELTKSNTKERKNLEKALKEHPSLK